MNKSRQSSPRHLKSLNPQPTNAYQEPEFKSSTWSHPTWFKSGEKPIKGTKLNNNLYGPKKLQVIKLN